MMGISLESMWEVILSVLMSTMGGLARVLYKNQRSFSMKKTFAELFIAGFCGVMILLFLRASGVSGEWVGIVCGMVGWTGPKTLDGLAEIIANIVRINAHK
ncbi:MAG: phage holin family protein [Symbiobacteriaceae bacterium]|nr:phage holin family protein [Symbiobacteriaceae bacterium]